MAVVWDVKLSLSAVRISPFLKTHLGAISLFFLTISAHIKYDKCLVHFFPVHKTVFMLADMVNFGECCLILHMFYVLKCFTDL